MAIASTEADTYITLASMLVVGASVDRRQLRRLRWERANGQVEVGRRDEEQHAQQKAQVGLHLRRRDGDVDDVVGWTD